MKIIFDKYGKIVGTPVTDDYWGQGDNNSTFLNVQFLDDNDQPIVFTSNQYLEVVVERPDGQVSPALLMTKTNDSYSQLTVGKLTITNWITEVAGKIKFSVRLKETDLNDYVTTKVTGICYRVIGQAIDPADQTITDAEYQALMDAFASKEDVANKSGTIDKYSTTKYPTHRLFYDYIHERIILPDTSYDSLAALETDINRGTRSVFAYKGIYSVKIGNNSAYDRAMVLVDYKSGDYGYHATIFNGSFIEVINGTLSTDQYSEGSLTTPKVSYKFDLTKIGLANDGTLSGLSTTNKNTLVAAINEIYTFLGTTNPNSFTENFDTPDSVLVCLNECRDYIAQFINGITQVKYAENADNATNDEDGNRIKTTYPKLYADNLFIGDNEFDGKTVFDKDVTTNADLFAKNIDVSQGGNYAGTHNFTGGAITVPVPAQNNNPVRLQDLNELDNAYATGTKVASKASKDNQGNTINTFYGHSITIISDPDTFQYVFQLKDASGNVLNQETIDLPIESVVVSGSYDSTNQKIVLTLENGNTIDIPVGALISGLQTEITNQNKLSSDLVDDTNHTNKFVSASEKAQIAQNAEDIAALDARMDDYSYAEMVYDSEDESLTVTGLAFSYNGDEEEITIIR